MQFFDLLSYTFFQHALLGSLFASIACGIIGSYVVIRRLVFISGGITHASLGGIGMGFYFGWNPIFTAMIFSILSAFGIEWLSSRQGVREDSAIGSFWSLGMAVGIIFIYLKPGFAPNLSDYLFGNILTITKPDIIYLAILSLVLTFVFLLFGRQILFAAFDPDFAKTRNLPVNLIKYVMMMAIAITIVLSIRLVGIVLLMSILTVPQMTANLFTSSFTKMILLSILIGFLGCIVGLFLSAVLDVPSGVFIIFTQIIVFLISRWIVKIMQKSKRHKVVVV
ncbi:metal ABC transporter permease [Dysgonomonas sp. Marseille-P4677]|uniref:metal ABC transporter permease n=1 Tax=Dysgonomonas sp. Marseille-P4677 TaxID=2364790 RepID=UPI0019122238|nr:metal ABC transporter permease [Dysgonomonas sp. Marseille-P4677]MBK5719951.1 metal ABC transporter permease [Dysgonomonas sp. Marseille-P4677]